MRSYTAYHGALLMMVFSGSMKTRGWTIALALVSQACAFKKNDFTEKYVTGTEDPDRTLPPMIIVPSFNATLPIDHFNASDDRTFPNRYFVSSVWYKPGGPVILFDFGEVGVSTISAAWYLAEWNGTVSAPVELAKQLNALIIGWEHRYYGTSLPFPSNGGTPTGGVADYQYLTVEQALEDVVYFSKYIFNATNLVFNQTASSGTEITTLNTTNLDPYHTPWIWVGGSYPGNRAAWARIRNPEVVYAAWASSAPVEVQEDGSAYFNSIYRALPKNCTTDIQAVMGYVDDALSSNSTSNNTAMLIKLGVSLISSGDSSMSFIEGVAEGLTDFDVASFLSQQILEVVQSYGVTNTAQVFCDWMESFDVQAYKVQRLGHEHQLDRAGQCLSVQ